MLWLDDGQGFVRLVALWGFVCGKRLIGCGSGSLLFLPLIHPTRTCGGATMHRARRGRFVCGVLCVVCLRRAALH